MKTSSQVKNKNKNKHEIRIQGIPKTTKIVQNVSAICHVYCICLNCGKIQL